MAGDEDVISKRIPIDGYNIYCEIRGSGDHVILFLPGAMGTCTTDFLHQYKGFDKSKFTMVTWDAPGYGNSRPPARNVRGNYYKRDAESAIKLMEELGYEKYSVVGFSDGGRTGLIMAAKAPDRIVKAVAWGCNAYFTPYEKDIVSRITSIKEWADEVKGPLEKIYGDELQPIWLSLCETWLGMENIFREDLPNIMCPVFILHGDKDPMVMKHHSEFFRSNIKRCRVHRFPYAGHNLQQTNPAEFNQLVQEFLLA